MDKTPSGNERIDIDRVKRMPTDPTPYEMRDWAEVARNYDSLVFSLNRAGDHLPLVWLDERRHNYDRTSFGLATYVGEYQKERDEGINCLGAVVGASLAGVDKTGTSGGRNWVAMCQNWFNRENGQDLYLNGKRTTTGGSFWYDLLPNVLAFQLSDLHPDVEELRDGTRRAADRWHEACVRLGDGDVTDPDFDHTGFDFEEMAPTDGEHREPEAAGAVAWLEYAAYLRFGDDRYLDAADGALDFLDGYVENPFYEVLLAHGAYTAARMNAELDREYDVERLFEWCFGPSDVRPGWGVVASKWGEHDCHGLVGSRSDSDGYAFAMNTFAATSAMVPIARYDQRFARTIGRWLLNAANSARLFYPAYLPTERQDNREWSDRNDEQDCLPYEGLRSLGWGAHAVEADHMTRYGETRGSYAETRREDGATQVLVDESVDGSTRLDHVWRMTLRSARRHTLTVVASTDAPVEFAYATDPDEEYTHMFIIDGETERATYELNERELVWMWNYDGGVYVRAHRRLPDHEPGRVAVDAIGAASIMGRPDDSYCSEDPGPYGTADAMFGFGSETNLSLYSGSHVGFLGAVVSTTGVERVLELDCLATDFFDGGAYPTSLYYNPREDPVAVTVEVGDPPRDLYELLGHGFIERDVTETQVEIPPDEAVVLVQTPANEAETVDDGKLSVDDTVVDYRYPAG